MSLGLSGSTSDSPGDSLGSSQAKAPQHYSLCESACSAVVPKPHISTGMVAAAASDDLGRFGVF